MLFRVSANASWLSDVVGTLENFLIPTPSNLKLTHIQIRMPKE